MQDKRSSPRYVVQDVKGTLHLSSEARILNMSLAGMAVEAAMQMKVGRKYTLTLRHGEFPAVHLAGTIAWCRLRTIRKGGDGESSPVYEAGVQFDNTLSGTATELLAFLKTSAVVTVDQRIAGRFRVKLPEPVNLAADFMFFVKTISVTGMLIETEFSPPVNSSFDMELDLDPEPCQVSGRIAYAHETTDQAGVKMSRLGVEFLQMSTRTRDAIEELITRKLQ